MIRKLIGSCALAVPLTLAVGCNSTPPSSNTANPGVAKTEAKTSGHVNAPRLDAPAKLPASPK